MKHLGRFQKLINVLKLYEMVYSTKDTKLKFLRSLPKEWKHVTVSLLYSHEFKDYNLEKLFGVLKTYEPQIQHDEVIEKGQVSSPCCKEQGSQGRRRQCGG